MKKKLFLGISILTGGLAFSQNTALQQKFKIEGGFQGINLTTEQPLSHKLLLAIDGGIGGKVKIPEGRSIEYRMGVTASENYLSPFLRAQLRYYFNRSQREANGHSLANNAGSFVGLQSKMVFNSKVDDVLVTDLHIGQQLPLGKNWTFRYHLGAGVGFNLAQGYGAFYPAIGCSFGYAF